VEEEREKERERDRERENKTTPFIYICNPQHHPPLVLFPE
jgi:hypothetical protein